MRLTTSLRKIATAAAMAALMCGAAFADIRGFNDAMQAKDYKKAAAEAASTWSTLDKNRADLAVIAREFSFAAFMASDYEAARTFGTTALAGAADTESRIGADLLLRLSEFKLTSSDVTRGKLLEAIQASATLPGIDLVTYIAINALTAYDVDADDWRAARVSAALGEDLTGRGKGAPSVDNLTFGLIRASAGYAVDRDRASYRDIMAVSTKVFAAIDGALTEQEAAKYEPVFWKLRAWEASAMTQLDLNKGEQDNPGEPGSRQVGPRVARLYSHEPPAGACKAIVPTFTQPVTYPSRAKVNTVAGAVIVKVDIDASGVTSNMEILAAAPHSYFGDAVYSVGNRVRFVKSPEAAPGCTLAQKGKVFTYVFQRVR